jgi:predicted nucleic acid-binding protein
VAAYYLDTSTLVKQYAQEQGTAWVTALVDPDAGHALYTVRLTGPEMVAALARKARTGALGAADAARAIQTFRRDWLAWDRVLSVSPTLIDRAMDLAQRQGLRGYDAVHLAAALAVASARRRSRLSTLIFVSADTEQRQAAIAEGLPVEDPNAYP